MENYIVKKEDLKKCLNLLKNYLYTERNYALAKSNIVEELSERTEEVIIDEVYNSLINYDEHYWANEIKKISYFVVPKKTTAQTNFSSNTTYINCIPPKQINIDELNIFIKYPTSIGIMNTLFIYLLGDTFESELPKDCLGNRLNTNEFKKFKPEGFTIYKSYFQQYKKWRDKSIRLAKEIHQNNNDVLLINLDLKRFFYSLNLDFTYIYKKSQTSKESNGTLSRIIQILEQTHEEFSKKIHLPNICLPIGLPSSGLLANWVLANFDKKAKSLSRAASYGRYVDDIIIVVSNPKLKEDNDFNFEISDYIPTIKSKKKKDTSIRVLPDEAISTSELYINNNKIRWFYFHKEESISLIDKFIQELNELSSEWKLLPDEAQLRKSLINESYSEVTSSDGSVKNLKDLIPNKNSLALYFEKAIIASMFDEQKKRNYSTELIEFFSGKQLLDNISFWDRAFTLTVSSKDPMSFVKLYRKIKYYINNIQFGQPDTKTNTNKKDSLLPDVVSKFLHPHINIKFIRKNLHDILDEVSAYAISLNLSFLKDHQDKDFDRIISLAKKIRTEGFCKRHYTVMPLFCSHFDVINDIHLDLTSIHSIHKILNLQLSKEKFKKVFHYIPLHELFIFIQLQEIVSSSQPQDLKIKTIETKATSLFQDINNLVCKTNFDIEKISHNSIQAYELRTPSAKDHDKLILGISSMRLEEHDVVNYIQSNQYDIQSNFLEISKIFNQAASENCNFLLFPESAVCLELLPILLRESSRNKMGLVFGLKHFIYNNYVFNLSCTTLPFQNGAFTNSLSILRPKNFFAPKEKCLFEQYYNKTGQKLICYEGMNTHFLFRWKDFTFTVFNCFELADIESRSLFRSKLDLLVAIEFNTDTNYFSNLIESSSRDIHCVAAQCNNSKYGDSRVTQPKKSEKRDMIKIKGGDNSYVVVCNLNFESLRNFQKMDYSGQLSSGEFKPTPPGFDRTYVFKREQKIK